MISAHALAARHLTKKYRQRTVVKDVSFHVEPGEVVGLLGPNGAGKTTSFSMVVGLVPLLSGRVALGDQSLEGLSMHERARKGLGYLPQESCIFRGLSVTDNLLVALERGALSSSERSQRARDALVEFGLSHVAESNAETLSGGERRRLEIARCLMQSPKFILFDEPFAGVDPLNVGELQKEMRRLKERRLGVLITDHNVRDTLRICDRAYVIADGTIVDHGTPEQLAASPIAQRTYLGQGFSL